MNVKYQIKNWNKVFEFLYFIAFVAKKVPSFPKIMIQKGACVHSVAIYIKGACNSFSLCSVRHYPFVSP
jgi:hypothetical protein